MDVCYQASSLFSELFLCPLIFFEFQGLRFHNTGLLTADQEVGSSNLPGRDIFFNDLAGSYLT